MTYAPRIVLLSPISNPSALEPFVEQCLRNKVILIAIVGDGCQQVEDLIDDIIIGDYYLASGRGDEVNLEEDRFIATSSHLDESVEDAIVFASRFRTKNLEKVEVVKL